MIEERTSMKEKVVNTFQKVKKYPKIWIPVLAFLSLIIGFIGGTASSNFYKRSPGHEEFRRSGQADFQKDGLKTKGFHQNRNFNKESQEPTDGDTDATSGASIVDDAESNQN